MGREYYSDGFLSRRIFLRKKNIFSVDYLGFCTANKDAVARKDICKDNILFSTELRYSNGNIEGVFLYKNEKAFGEWEIQFFHRGSYLRFIRKIDKEGNTKRILFRNSGMIKEFSFKECYIIHYDNYGVPEE
jgi:hypothetical protein